VVDTPTRGTRRAPSVPARSCSFRSLSPPILSPACGIELLQSVPVRTGRDASSQSAPSLSPSQSTFSYGAPSPPIGSDIEVKYPVVRPIAFQPMPLGASADIDTSVYADRARPVAAGVGRISLPYVNVDVNVRWPGSAAGPRLFESATSAFAGVPSAAVAQPGSLDVASARTHTSSDTPMPLSDVGQRSLARPMHVDVPRPLDLTLPIASDVVYLYALPPGDFDVAGPAYGPAPLTVVDAVRPSGPPSADVPRPTGVDVRRPMTPMGVRQSKSSVSVSRPEVPILGHFLVSHAACHLWLDQTYLVWHMVGTGW